MPTRADTGLAPNKIRHYNGHKRARVACTQCRQAKVRCDVENVPCGRCQNLNLDCAIERSYKRRSKADQMHDLQKQVSSLQGALHGRTALDESWSESSDCPGPQINDQQVSPNLPAGASDTVSHNGLVGREVQTPDTADYRLGAVTLTLPKAREMFKTYADSYNPLLPILQTVPSPEVCHAASPFLFWTIVSVSVRHLSHEEKFLYALTPELSNLVWKSIASDLMKLRTIQAILILATWPLPDLHMWTDRSLVIVNMALTTAQLLGFHRPGHEHEYSRQPIKPNQPEATERHLAWFALVTQSASLAMDAGLPPPAALDDCTVRPACAGQPADIPNTIWQNLVVNQAVSGCIRDFNRTVDESANIEAAPIAIDLLEQTGRHLEDLRAQFDSDLSFLNRIQLLASKMAVQCLHFLLEGDTPQREAGIIRAYHAAIAVLSLLLSDDTTYKTLPFAPALVGRIVFHAGLVVLRVIHSTAGNGLDYDLAKNMVNAASFSLKHLSARHNEQDQPFRGAEMLKRFWRAAANSPRWNLQLYVKTRMTVSLAYDCLYLFRHREQPESQANASVLPAVPAEQPDGYSQSDIVHRTDGLASDSQQDEQFQYPGDLFMFTPTDDFQDFAMLDDIGYSSFFQ